jgi:two-component system, chemotaxis family, chemotaxis protein CheY
MNSKLRILLVDDMPAMRSVLRTMLQEAGFADIVEVEDGDAAWRIIQDSVDLTDQAPGLVIADWNMPAMSGMELLRAIRSFSLTRKLPVLIVTGERNPEYLSEAIYAGVTDFIAKPFTSVQLKEKIQKALLSC